MSAGDYPVVVFHDVIAQGEIEYMKTEAAKKLKNNAARLLDDQHVILHKLSGRLEHITKLAIINQPILSNR